MQLKPRVRDMLWMAAGAAVLLVVVLVVYFERWRSPAGATGFKAQEINLVEEMRFSLAAASEAEKSAVLAVTDRESETFAGQARAASAEVERRRKSLGELFAAGASPKETDLFARFSKVFAEFQVIDRALLALTVRNTNVKAFALAFGPAAQAANQTDAAISSFLEKHATAPQTTLLQAAGVQASTLRLETRLAPHIAEESDQRMDQLETLMAKDDREVRAALDGLAAQPGLRTDHDLATARSSYARFTEVRKQILALSRENTNVRSLAISLNQKRKVMALCQDTLSALQQQIANEPVPVAPSNPRRLNPEAQATR